MQKVRIKRKMLFQEINKLIKSGEEAYKHFRAKDMVYPHICIFCKKTIPIGEEYREINIREKGTSWSSKKSVCVCLECEKRFV